MKKDVFEVASEMEGCMRSLEQLCKKLDGIGEEKVEAQVEYDKELQIALEQLKAEGSPVTTRKDIAKGMLANNGTTRRLGLAEIRYKALHTKISAAESALNGWQSYNRHLETGTR